MLINLFQKLFFGRATIFFSKMKIKGISNLLNNSNVVHSSKKNGVGLHKVVVPFLWFLPIVGCAIAAHFWQKIHKNWHKLPLFRPHASYKLKIHHTKYIHSLKKTKIPDNKENKKQIVIIKKFLDFLEYNHAK